MRERSLVAFTLLMQIAVGAFWVIGAVGLKLVATSLIIYRVLYLPLFMIAGGALCALIISLFHLGTPLNAWRAMANLRTSWLSREILFASLFTGMALVSALLVWLDLGTAALLKVVFALTALLGLALVFSMARLYMLRTVPAWNRLETPLSFLVTTLLLGHLGAGLGLWVTLRDLLFRWNADRAVPAFYDALHLLRWMCSATLTLLVVELLLLVLWEAVRGLHSGNWRFFIRLGLLLAAGVLLLQLMAESDPGRFIGLLGMVFGVSGLLVLISELIGRVVFYAAYQRQGM